MDASLQHEIWRRAESQCEYCNLHKGPNIAGIDPDTGLVVPLFHPRRQIWREHFRWERAILVGLTGAGRATVDVLAINDPDYVAVRESLIREDVFPPQPRSG